jgi:hypothetical protein
MEEEEEEEEEEEKEEKEEERKAGTIASSQKLIGSNGTPAPLTVVVIPVSSAAMPE